MNIFDRIRLFFLNRAIRKELRHIQRRKKLFNLQEAKSVGVVYNAATENDYSRAASLIRHLQAQGKMVKSIGFVPLKELPHYTPMKLNFDFVSLKDLNWYRKPKGQFVSDFIKQEFDILIDLNLTGIDSMRYIVSLSRAKFKIGRYTDDHKDIYDFMLEGIEDNQVSLFIKEVLHYLEMFKTKS